MREIKFRVWDKQESQMLDLNGACGYEERCLMDCIGRTDFDIMQFTGLKDKSGKDIYEGDILNSETEGHVGVEWENEFACFGTFWFEDFEDEDTGKIVRIKRRGGLLANDLSDCPNLIVCGNIYEHPHLLK